MEKSIRSEGLHYTRRQLKRATDPIAIDVLTYHIKLTEERLEKMA